MKQRILPTDVLEVLEKEVHTTRQKIAQKLDCSTATISKKVAKLVEDGENIGFDKYGLFIYQKDDMGDRQNAADARNWGRRIINSLTMWAKRGNNTRPVLVEARRRWGKELSREERGQLKSNLLMITRVVDAVELDEELRT